MRKPVCVPCGLAMYPEQNGVVVLETKDKAKAQPYRLWRSDKWKCPGCGYEVLSGYSDRCIYPGDPDYDEDVKKVELIFY